MTGTVKSFNEERGYGFIAVPGGRDIFVHITACEEILQAGDVVEYDLFATNKGPKAANVFVRIRNANQQQ